MRLFILFYILLIRGFFDSEIFVLGYYLKIEYFYYLSSGMEYKLPSHYLVQITIH